MAGQCWPLAEHRTMALMTKAVHTPRAKSYDLKELGQYGPTLIGCCARASHSTGRLARGRCYRKQSRTRGNAERRAIGRACRILRTRRCPPPSYRRLGYHAQEGPHCLYGE